ncbi:Fpg/Nei family DNA glycosylase [Actibacterium sp. MT2.3-13A]|uniref:Fpg/Nei family DNA glycosylase n=1 Tax=Actibacterium sp. MT2.3-13A TaxID=2828332 RepID=UPI001BABAD1B|nr:Fpg/Nei family DNA glycosylase [Actibacterium sp. MT2.3-13A]
MPELPEVEVFRREFAARGLGKMIEGVHLIAPRSLRGATGEALRAALEGDRFAGVARHGKILFARTARGPTLVIHFGMTGALRFCAAGQAAPKGALLGLTFAGGPLCAVVSQRRLGWLELTDDRLAYLRERGIGPDALSLSARDFAERIGAGRGSLKTALMDQSKIAGIGNVYSDEILFRAGLAPRSKGRDLSREGLEALHRTLRAVLEGAVGILASGAELPPDWLARHREAGAACPRCGRPLRRERIGGRSAYSCPRCQRGGAG